MSNVDLYIATFPAGVQEILLKIRSLVFEAAPDAVETLSYGMPSYKTHGKVLIYYAAFSKHIGLYATPSGHQAFERELSAYKRGKGSVQFPLDQPIPYELIRQIIEFRVYENQPDTEKS